MKIRLSSKLVAAIVLFSGLVSGALDSLPAFQQRGSQKPKRTSSLLISQYLFALVTTAHTDIIQILMLNRTCRLLRRPLRLQVPLV
jgi:hypothetical protein